MPTNPTAYQRKYMQQYRTDSTTEMKRILGSRCSVRGCKETRLSYLEFHHRKPICRKGNVDNLCLVQRDFNNMTLSQFRKKYCLMCFSCHDKLNGTANTICNKKRRR